MFIKFEPANEQKNIKTIYQYGYVVSNKIIHRSYS